MKKILLLVLLIALIGFISCSDKEEDSLENMIKLESIKLEPGSLTLIEGETSEVSYTLIPENAAYKKLQWESDNTSVATVEKGIVSAIKAGQCKISLVSDNGVKESCIVNVKSSELGVESINFTENEISANIGDNITLEVKILPENATNKNYSFVSGSETIATVDSKGVVTCLAQGIVTITVNSEEGNKSDICKIGIAEKDHMMDLRDGHVYKTVTIGEQTWLAENFAYLPSVNLLDDSSRTESRYYVYGYDGETPKDAKECKEYDVYGVYYNYQAAVSCAPNGWHLASDEEWQELELFTKSVSEKEIKDVGERGDGHILRSYDGWRKDPGYDEYGFAAKGAGCYVFCSDNKGYTYNATRWAYFWTSTEGEYSDESTGDISMGAWERVFGVDSYYGGIYRTTNDASKGYSVRLIKDK